MKLMFSFFLLPLLIPFPLQAQPLSGDTKTQQLVNALKSLTDQAEQNRSANYRFIDQLRDLTARYDRPWTKRILFDDFRDGDFLRNPAWYSSSNDFWVTRSVGLRTELDRQSNQPPTNPQKKSGRERTRDARDAIIGMILGAGVEQQEPEYRPSNRPVRADISSNIAINNAFAITVKLSVMGRGNSQGSFEFGPYQGQNMESGYRLIYRGGTTPALKLVSYRRQMTSVIDLYDRGKLLQDGNMHTLSWQRRRSGQMTVLLDGNQILSVRDRSYRDSFSGFVMTNRGGDYGIRSVSIFAAGQ